MKQLCVLLSLLLLASGLAGCNRETPPPAVSTPGEATPAAPMSDNAVSQFPLPDLNPDGPAPWEDWADDLGEEWDDALDSMEESSAPAETAPAPTSQPAPEVRQPADPQADPQAPAASGETAQAAAAPATAGLSSEAIELELFHLINRERESAGLPALGMEESMQWAARMRAPEAMNDLSHTRPGGAPYYTAFDEAGFPYAGKYHGENVSTMFFPSGAYTAETAALKMFEALKSSSGHYHNMLSEHFSQAGIGVAIREENGTTYLSSAQLFSSF